MTRAIFIKFFSLNCKIRPISSILYCVSPKFHFSLCKLYGITWNKSLQNISVLQCLPLSANNLVACTRKLDSTQNHFHYTAAADRVDSPLPFPGSIYRDAVGRCVRVLIEGSSDAN